MSMLLGNSIIVGLSIVLITAGCNDAENEKMMIQSDVLYAEWFMCQHVTLKLLSDYYEIDYPRERLRAIEAIKLQREAMKIVEHDQKLTNKEKNC